MLSRRLVLTGLGATTVAAFVPGALWAAPIKPDAASALIVIDVQNCFLPGGSLAVKDGEQVVPIINRLAKDFANVVMTQDWHTAGHVSFASTHSGKKPFETVDLSYGKQVLWPDHCVQGTEGASLSKDLAIPHAGLVIRKGFNKNVDSYSAFTEADGKTTTGLAESRSLSRDFARLDALDAGLGHVGPGLGERALGVDAAAGVFDDVGFKARLARIERGPCDAEIGGEARHEQPLDLARLQVGGEPGRGLAVGLGEGRVAVDVLVKALADDETGMRDREVF